MTEQEALAIVGAIADGKRLNQWPEVERWQAVCIVLLKLRGVIDLRLGDASIARGHGGAGDD